MNDKKPKPVNFRINFTTKLEPDLFNRYAAFRTVKLNKTVIFQKLLEDALFSPQLLQLLNTGKYQFILATCTLDPAFNTFCPVNVAGKELSEIGKRCVNIRCPKNTFSLDCEALKKAAEAKPNAAPQ